MRVPFLPTILADDVTQLTPQFLRERGIRLLMLDFDNTIVPYTANTPIEAVREWLESMQTSDIQICVVSNSHKERVKTFCGERGIDCITHAKKPFSKGILECLGRYALPLENCALVGDQIYTDVLGANCAGIQSILIKAIHNHNFWLQARHVLEIPWILISGKRKQSINLSRKL